MTAPAQVWKSFSGPMPEQTEWWTLTVTGLLRIDHWINGAEGTLPGRGEMCRAIAGLWLFAGNHGVSRINDWDRASPGELASEAWWRSAFALVGPFAVRVVDGKMHIEDIQDYDPEKVLYRSATPGREYGWGWDQEMVRALWLGTARAQRNIYIGRVPAPFFVVIGDSGQVVEIVGDPKGVGLLHRSGSYEDAANQNVENLLDRLAERTNTPWRTPCEPQPQGAQAEAVRVAKLRCGRA